MKKHILFLLLFLMAMSSVSAFRARQIIPGQISGMLQYILVDLPKSYGQPPFVVYAKLLMWVLVFAIMNMAAKSLKGFPVKTANIISLVLSLMSVLLMPEHWIAFIFKEYSMVIAIALAGVPLIIGLFLNMSIIKGDSQGMKILKGFIWILVGIFTLSLSTVMSTWV